MMAQAFALILVAWLQALQASASTQNPATRAELRLTDAWAISVSASAHPAVQRAARDIQGFMSERHGLRLRIGGAEARKSIVVKAQPGDGSDRLTIRTFAEEERILVAGSSPRAAYQAALLFEEMLEDGPALPATTERVVTIPFRDRYLLWNSLLTGQNKGALRFDLEKHIREAVRLGYTGMECNRFVGMNLPQQGNPRDPYPWYTYWGPSMDQFVSSPLFEGVFPPDYLARNLADLKHLAALVQSFGLKPIFMGYEPRFVPEAFLQSHPDLRGPRVDHPLRSMASRHSLCTDRPEVLNHYRTLAGRLIREVPQIAEMHVIIMDSGAGFCWGDSLYAGRNGPAFCRNVPTGERFARFFGAIRQGFNDAGTDIPLVVQTHGNSRREMEAFFDRVPGEVSLTAGNWASWSLSHHDPLGVDRFVIRRSKETARRVLYYQQHFFGFDVAPTSEFPLPYYLAERLKRAQELGLDALNTLGGMVSPPILDRSAMQEVFRRFLLEPNLPPGELVVRTARALGGVEGGKILEESWKRIHQAVEANGHQIGFALGTEYASRRTLVRPLVPDAAELTPEERDWWQAYAFAGDLRFGHAHLFRNEGGLPAQSWYEQNRDRSARAAEAFRAGSNALLGFLNRHATESKDRPYLAAHERQLRFIAHVYTTGANLYEGQRIMDKYSRKAIEDEYKQTLEADLAKFQQTVRDEIANTEALRKLVEGGGEFGMILLPEETTWGFSTNLPALLRKKAAVMTSRLPEARSVMTRFFDSEY